MNKPKHISEYWERPENAPPHPYREYENTPMWQVVKQALYDLEGNQDLKLNEWHEYVVGYICKQLAIGGFGQQEKAANSPSGQSDA